MNEMERDFFDENAHHWDEIAIHDLDVVRFLADSLELEGHESILDVGTGTGIMLPFYRERTDGPVTAVDFSSSMLKVAESKYPAKEYGIEYVVSDVYEYSPNKTFDVIVCYSCFPHFEDKPGAIAHLASMLPKGGKLMISHGCSRDHINRVHENGGEVIREDHLPDMPHLRAMIEENGMNTFAEFDDDRMFGIVAVKT